jgi:hypothetical protein
MVGQVTQAPDRLADNAERGPVTVGSLLAEAGDVRDHEIRPGLVQGLLVQAQLGELPRPEVLDQRVAALDQAQHDPGGLRMLQVERDAALVAGVGRPPERVAVELLAPLPHGITVRRLDLDDVRAKIAKQPCAEGCRNEMADLENAQASQRPVASGLFHVSLSSCSAAAPDCPSVRRTSHLHSRRMRCPPRHLRSRVKLPRSLPVAGAREWPAHPESRGAGRLVVIRACLVTGRG